MVSIRPCTTVTACTALCVDNAGEPWISTRSGRELGDQPQLDTRLRVVLVWNPRRHDYMALVTNLVACTVSTASAADPLAHEAVVERAGLAGSALVIPRAASACPGDTGAGHSAARGGLTAERLGEVDAHALPLRLGPRKQVLRGSRCAGCVGRGRRRCGELCAQRGERGRRRRRRRLDRQRCRHALYGQTIAQRGAEVERGPRVADDGSRRAGEGQSREVWQTSCHHRKLSCRRTRPRLRPGVSLRRRRLRVRSWSCVRAPRQRRTTAGRSGRERVFRTPSWPREPLHRLAGAPRTDARCRRCPARTGTWSAGCRAARCTRGGPARRSRARAGGPRWFGRW